MKRTWKRTAVCAAIALAGVVVTLLLSGVQVFQGISLKAQDAHFIFRGVLPVRDTVIIGIDEKAANNFSELYDFWHPYYAEAMKAAADAGAKAFVLDVAFGVPVTKYEPDNDSKLAEALIYANQKIPVVTGFVASTADQKKAAFAVPVNMLAATFRTYAFANLTIDSDSFVRRQELFEEPEAGEPDESVTRSMALRAAERISGQDARFRNGSLFLGGRRIPLGDHRDLTVNFAGPPGTFPEVSLYDFINAARAGDRTRLEQWVKGKAVFLGPYNDNDRHDTPFYTFFQGTKWETPGVEIHANTVRTLLTGDFLRPVPEWARVAALVITAGGTIAVVASVAAAWQTAISALIVLVTALIITHILFIGGWLLSSFDMTMAFAFSLLGGVIYRFATAEKKSSFFRSAVALFVGKDVAKSLEQSEKIGLTGQRRMVTILFSDIRGFTAFCESKDPAVIVDLLNGYMATMCGIIVKHHGHVNKFIGDGILAVFSDLDDGAEPGGHAARAVRCALEMVTAPGEFATGTGMHSGEVVIGNVGSSDKMEFTVLGDTVNLASRLESLNKEHKTKLLLSGTTHEMAGGGIDTVYLGAIPVRGKTEPMKLYTVASLITEEIRRSHHLEESVPA
ncbi:MAG TPA: adenylate/guanylate cyclase domain-containing protein [Bryobacteraceae bacterium]|jgi:adenylate cyclase